jgi:hypothetical protein
VIERREFARMPAGGDLVAWQTWLRRHGIDPHEVVADPRGWIERREHAYQVAYLAAVFDGTRFTDEFETKVVQLEGPPLPFPVVGR